MSTQGPFRPEGEIAAAIGARSGIGGGGVVEPGQAVYAATKAAIVQLVRTAAAEFGPDGVRVNAVAPGVVETPLTAPIKANKEWYDAYAAKSVFRRWAQPDEIAAPTVFLA